MGWESLTLYEMAKVNRRGRHVYAALVRRARGSLMKLLDPDAWTRITWLYNEHRRRKLRLYATLKQMRCE